MCSGIQEITTPTLGNDPVHDPSGTGEIDSQSGVVSYENRTRFHARLGCDPVDCYQPGGSLCVFLDQCWYAGWDPSGQRSGEMPERFKGCVKGWREG